MIAYKASLVGKKVSIKDTTGDWVLTDKVTELMQYLVMQYKDIDDHHAHARVFWDLDTAVADMFSLLDDNQKRDLVERRRTSFLTGEPQRYTITYNPNKVLGISCGGRQALFYNLRQFFVPEYPEYTELPMILKAGNQLMRELYSIGIKPTRLTSAAALVDFVYERIDLPTHLDIPAVACSYAWQNTGCHWTEAHKLGYFPKTFDYDLRGGYPSVVANLLDTRYGDWKHTNKKFDPVATYGIYECMVAIHKDFSPIPYVDAKHELFWCRGYWKSWLTKCEIDFIYKYELGTVKVLDGYSWYCKKVVRPLQLAVFKLFKDRQKSPLLNKVLKQAMASMYGLFLQEYSSGGFGDHFNPVWGGLVEAHTRCNVGKFVLDNKLEKDVVLVATDGFLATREVPVKDNGLLGSWKLSGASPALSIGSSMVFYGNKRPCQLTYKEALEMVKEHPKARRWKKKKTRRLVLEDVLKGYKGKNNIMEVETGFSMPIEYDRKYDILPLDGKDLLAHTYDSKPLWSKNLTKRILFENEAYG